MAEYRERSRQGHQRKHIRKVWRAVSVAVVVISVLAGSIFLFKVERIDVDGASRYSEERVIDACGVGNDENLLLLKRSSVARSIMTQLPYVENVSIRRRLPDTLRITLHEAPIAGLVYDGTELWVIDSHGKVMERTPLEELNGSGPWIEGLTVQEGAAVGRLLPVAEEEQEVFSYLQQLLHALEDAEMLEDVSGISCSSAGNLIFDWEGRFTVLLPIQCDFDYKLRYLQSIVKLLEDSESGRIDLTREEAHFIPKQIY